ncbi:hypothetical protein CAEBREN_06956 [Caenorhabditis brenneri]|uniref:Protein kinase domain-containing protein n=1 Tax=Caenorhabditis brenneri TaxID=135651 RepID=G0NUB1_CAEBE|nr:hypothetical protein CAEBREN_06956 [Caenorhabditis brenneri]
MSLNGNRSMLAEKDERNQLTIITLPFKIRDIKFGKEGYCPVEDGEILRNRFKIKRMVGSGSYGSVHLAEEKHTKRTVALKIVRSGEFF